MSNSFKLTATSAQQILANRGIITAMQDGDTIRFHVQGNGNTIPVVNKDNQPVMANGTQIPLMKTIYGLKCNSHVAVINPLNKIIFTEGVKAEGDGDVDLAHEKFNQYLNKVQVSFSVLHNPGREPQKFYDRQLIEGEVKLITTEKGQLLTLENVRAVAVAKVGKMPAFTINDLMGIDGEATPEKVFTETGATAGVQ